MADERQAANDQAARVTPTGGTKVSEGRWPTLAPQWAIVAGQIRTMDVAELGETEPSVTFGWQGERA